MRFSAMGPSLAASFLPAAKTGKTVASSLSFPIFSGCPNPGSNQVKIQAS